MDNYRLVPGDSVGKKIDFLDRKVNPLEVPPEVSIILPAYNAHNTIKRTIASICMQDCVNEIEIIIADDCGDESYDRIAQQFSHMVRIKIVKMLKNGGPGAARQIGFDYSVGKYIMWMDADDTLVSSDTITTLKNVMIERQMDCVYGKFLEQNEDGSIYPHELHMVWMFGKLYRREFLEKYNIRFNTSLSNEDTGFNRLVCACTDKIWYIPKDVYIWQFKANSITRIKQGMYGQDSGYKGYLDNMIWQILESEKRFVNKNYILNEIIQVMCILYHFHVENMQQCPMNTDTSMNWIRGYYDIVYKPHEDEITPAMFDNVFAQTAAGQNIAQKGIIPRLTIYEFMEEVKKPWVEDHDQEIRGSTPAGYIPPITDKEWPVEVTEYVTMVEDTYNVDSDTNFSRYGGMKRKLGLEITDKDYDIHYTGKSQSEDITQINSNSYKNTGFTTVIGTIQEGNDGKQTCDKNLRTYDTDMIKSCIEKSDITAQQGFEKTDAVPCDTVDANGTLMDKERVNEYCTGTKHSCSNDECGMYSPCDPKSNIITAKLASCFETYDPNKTK